MSDGFSDEVGQLSQRLRQRTAALPDMSGFSERVRCAVELSLVSVLPSQVWVGADLSVIHNDACLPLMGSRASGVLGAPASQVWIDFWPSIDACVRLLQSEGTAQSTADLNLPRESDDTQRSLRFFLSPIIDIEGSRIEAIACTILDTTDSVRAQSFARIRAEDIASSEARFEHQRLLYEAILSNTPDLAYVFDAQHRFVYANEGLLKMWGRTWQEAIGKNCLDLGYEPWHAAMHDREIDHVMATGKSIRGEVPFEGAFGRRTYDYIMVPVYSGTRIVAVAGTTRDVTEYRLSQDELRENRKRIEFAMEAAQIGEWDLDIRSDESRRSLRHDHCFGYSSPVDNWGFATFIQHVHADDRAAVEKNYRDTIARHAELDLECRVIWPDGSVHWIVMRGSIYRSEEGQPTHMLGIIADITARKESENSLRALAAELSESDRRKNEFLAMLAHELRNPLAPVRSALHVLRRSADDADKVQITTEVMERQITQMVRLVDDLLDVSRISRGKIELRRSVLDLGPVIEHAIETCRPALELAGQHLETSVPEGPLLLDADSARLTQVFSNLLSNASKFSGRGAHIALRVETAGDTVRIAISDDGIGIAPEKIGQIFEMFIQVDQSLERSQGGLGIGLMLVKTIVELHSGRIQASSAGPGQGSEFVVILPLLRAGESSAIPATRDKVAVKRSRRILVVDDNRESANLLALALQLAGHETHAAHDGLIAVETAARLSPDVVLLDIGLPGLNGYEAGRRIRSQNHGRPLILIALTGRGESDDREKSRAAGFDAHWVKPIDPRAVDELLSGLLGA
ncbi:MAG: ATP-binding protein [Tahibacter sp.]